MAAPQITHAAASAAILAHADAIKLCECGCGAPAPIAQRNCRRKGEVKGQPLRFISGHNSRGTADLTRYESTDGGYVSPCWLWKGPLNRKGYGRTQINGVHHQAHRALYTWLRGPVSADLHLDHLCRNKWCVNPDHMEPVSPAVNERRKRAALKAQALDQSMFTSLLDLIEAAVADAEAAQ